MKLAHSDTRRRIAIELFAVLQHPARLGEQAVYGFAGAFFRLWQGSCLLRFVQLLTRDSIEAN